VGQPDDHMKLITAFYPPHLTTSLRFNSLENLLLRVILVPHPQVMFNSLFFFALNIKVSIIDPYALSEVL